MIDFNEGHTILIDKALDWTSFDVVKVVRNRTRAKKVGHAGTLDPKATGLLIVCTGKFTKRIEEFQALEKEYTGIFRIGAITPSFDLETEETNHTDYHHISREAILTAAAALTGEIEQEPPVFSAIKVKGKRAYHSARRGEEIKLKSRPVSISEFIIEEVDFPDVHFRIRCSKGTYIRSIARDFGNILGVGAYLKALRRTAIGDYRVEDAQTMPEFEDFIRRIKES